MSTSDLVWPIPIEIAKTLCRLGQAASCCRYLVGGQKGTECVKLHPSAKAAIDKRAAQPDWISKGDNCSGPPDYMRKRDGHEGAVREEPPTEKA